MAMWSPWKGCHQFSDGCLNCYYYGQGKENKPVLRNEERFFLPLLKNKKGDYQVKSGQTLFVCFSSDFLIE